MRGQQQENNKSLDFYLIIVFVGAIVAGLWLFYHEIIVEYIFMVRVFFGHYLMILIDESIWVFDHLQVSQPDIFEEFKFSVDYMQKSNPKNITIEDLYYISNLYGSLISIAAVVFGFFAALYMSFFHALARYRNIYTMVTLSKEEVVNWPHIMPVIERNLTKINLSDGAWAMSLRPMDFCKKHGLVYQGSGPDNKPMACLKIPEAYRVFSLQMGPLWNGLEKLPPYVLALFAIFAAKGCGNDKGAKNLMRQISKSTEKGRLDFGGTRELLILHVRDIKVGRAVGPHAYLYTVMASMLELARTDGVLAAAEFLWLKPIDRSLWFVLNSVGRQTPFCDVAGPISHFIVEKRLRRPLKVPMVKEAVNAMEIALKEIVYHPDDN